MNQAQLELQAAHEVTQNQRRRTIEMLSNMSTELVDIGQILSTSSMGSSFKIHMPFSLDAAAKSEKLDEEFMVTKLSMSRLKSDIRSLVQVCVIYHGRWTISHLWIYLIVFS